MMAEKNKSYFSHTYLCLQFFLRSEDVGKPRAEAVQHKLAELNQYVPVHLMSEDVTAERLDNFEASFGIILFVIFTMSGLYGFNVSICLNIRI